AAGDSITTPANGSASIKYTNGTLVNLSGGTNYKILSYTPKQAAVQIKAELNHGTINSKTSGTTKETIKTPIMALAVLGTKYELSVACIRQTNTHHKGKCTNTLALRVFQGVVEAGGRMVTAGSSVIITSAGVRPASSSSSIQINNAAAGTVSTVNVQNTNSSSSGGAAVTTMPPPAPPPPTPPPPPIGP
ncbi:MAG: FecR domain-containing protein, partial [Legionella sp.]